jgi:hypothetical protein
VRRARDGGFTQAYEQYGSVPPAMWAKTSPKESTPSMGRQMYFSYGNGFGPEWSARDWARERLKRLD